MAEAAMKVTAEMLGPKEGSAAAAPEDREYMAYDLARLAAFAELDVDFKKARNADFLESLAQEHIQMLVNKVFALPSEPAEVGRLVQLPLPTMPLPREKPVPKAKVQTRWEKFALAKGIQNRKRSVQVWDEDTQSYKRRWGYDRANDEQDTWVVEHKTGQKTEPGSDPWTEMRKAKKERVARNKANQEANVRAAAGGSRKALPGALDLASVLGAQKPGKRSAAHKERKLPSHTDVALRVAQRSTASMGKFDVKRKGEPALLAARVKRRDDVLARPDNERARHAAVMKKVLGSVKEGESMSMKRAMASIGAGDVGKGEITTARAVMKKRDLKKKVGSAKADNAKKRAEAHKMGSRRGANKGKVKGGMAGKGGRGGKGKQ